ncbi:hypothetical protein [Streptomyces sp. NPDC020362]|uniref:hypothetical protein n=1 Tax=unclassified Streptomyces TaxID=2593676 RepID=UPI000B023AAB
MHMFMVVAAWLAVALFAAGGIAGIRADWVPPWLRHRVVRPRLWGYGALLMTLGLSLLLLTGPLHVTRFGGFGFFAWSVVFLAGALLQVLSQSPGRNTTKTSS